MHLRRKRVFILLLLVAVAVFVPPFLKINHFHKQLENSASGALGRVVTFDDGLEFRLLPQPAFVLRNFVVQDDPAFSAEPVLRAETVTARLRLSSLWRGRLEIARLSFQYPSLNLVRNAEGRWNMESLVQRASQVQTAPTGRTQHQSVPRFPYIEAESGRINFKYGYEKRAASFMEADFALWLESENQWNMRLEARPTRTDANLRDTGTVRLDGSLMRLHGEPLEQAKFKLTAEWDKAQLGQLTSLLTGHDGGWRGNVHVKSDLEGSLQDLRVTMDADLADFRRYDITSAESFNSRLHCLANFSAEPQNHSAAVTNFTCNAPLATGEITATGALDIAPAFEYRIELSAKDVPLAPAAVLARRTKLQLPSDLLVAGTLNSKLTFVHSGQRTIGNSGEGIIHDLRISAKSTDSDFNLGTVRFGFVNPIAAKTGKAQSSPVQSSISQVFAIDPFAVDLGGKQPAIATVRITPEGMTVLLKGDGDLDRFLSAAKSFGLASRDYGANGKVSFDLAMANSWTGFAAPLTTGTVQLRQVVAKTAGIATPLELAGANLSLTPEQIRVDKISADLNGTSGTWEGSIIVPRLCDAENCTPQFDLSVSELNLDELNRLFNPAFRKSNWLTLPRKFMGGDRAESALMLLRAKGNLRASHVVMKSLVANKVTATVTLGNGRLEFADLRAEVLGGKHQGRWRADFSTDSPSYAGKGTLDGASFNQINSIMKDSWATGTIRADYDLALTGKQVNELKDSVSGIVSFAWKNGSLRHVTADGKAFQFNAWTGSAKINGGEIKLTSGEAMNGSTRYVTTGSADFGRELKLEFASEDKLLQITGQLEKPLVEIAETPVAQSASNKKNAQVKPTSN